jgi:uncharacterized protein YjiK
MRFKGFVIITSIVTITSSSFYLLTKKPNIPYNLNSPSSKITLPQILHEISGLTNVSDSTIACIQDEKGIVFIYDFLQKKIIKEYIFAPDEDYEGITKVNNSFYVLRSDGTLFEIVNYLDSNFKINEYSTNITAKDNEGICYDKENNQLLIASKSKIQKGNDFKTKRGIYSFNLNTKTSTKKPYYLLDINEFNEKILYKKTKKNKVLKFKMSGIAIHPITNDIYILSASDFMLFVFDKTGAAKNAIELNSFIYNKAEGITFLNNGNMIISNEGQQGDPTLLLFEYIG